MFNQLFSSYSFPFDSYLSPTEERKRKSEQNDYEYARELQRQEFERYKVLRKQFELERSAESLGVLAKKQVVQYNNKSTGTKHKAFIIDTHLDDGPDKPYYTIKYQKVQTVKDESNNDQSQLIEVEKQTDGDRLKRVIWDEDEAWAAIHGRII
eukprot:CAMPEP_0178968540 /NCGR_PEP_ID=MMETSP0789-20121207/18328_1 /TAXON_ID=3005 /ORGANISM="Rhizosolenia setigera, Strain CCMP 1694" /LENGTH=152 /DNA_ID=CAMNT_0020654515 /DNA_START=67 /DNA_END=525 /DNA_ORIENTATION=-